jgi:hypothetical protein
MSSTNIGSDTAISTEAVSGGVAGERSITPTSSHRHSPTATRFDFASNGLIGSVGRCPFELADSVVGGDAPHERRWSVHQGVGHEHRPELAGRVGVR